MILRNDTADKTIEFVTIGEIIFRNIYQSDLVVQFVHVLGVFVQIDNISACFLDLTIHFFEHLSGLAFSLSAYDQFYHVVIPPKKLILTENNYSLKVST